MSGHEQPATPGPLASLDTALRFLTSVPLPWPPLAPTAGIAGALPYFPLVGALIGLALLAVGWLAGVFWPPLASAALLVIAWGTLSGGLHLDGLSDTADGVMSWRPREHKLEIMRDSRIGVMGALALIGALLLKLAFLAGAGANWWRAALLAPILGRWAMIYAIARFPAARADGLGSSVQGRLPLAHLLLAGTLVFIAAAAVAGPNGLAACLLAALGAHLLGRWWTHELGGLTGDTYGACCELVEVIALAALTAEVRI